MHWFSVDKKGLAELLELRGKEFILFELLQNAFDEESTKVQVTFEKLPGRPAARLIVEDDNPEGFKDLSHAWTMFARSTKRDDPTKRGRFNLGEKLVLACCYDASITTTTGTVYFGDKGRRRSSEKRDAGSVFQARLRCNQQEFDAILDAAQMVIPPPHIRTTFNGVPLDAGEPIRSVEVSLPTIVETEAGQLVERTRKTHIDLYEAGENGGYIYEMGIPIVETGDSYHCNIQQKVPLNMDRDNVRPAYLAKVRAAVLNETFDLLDEDAASEAWVTAALGHRDAEPSAVKSMITKRFGEHVVAVDPSDREAENRAKAKGYTVLHGGTFNSSQWENIRSSEAAPSAGKVFPSPKPYGDGPPADEYLEEKWTDGMWAVVNLTEILGRELLGFSPSVRLMDTPNGFRAAWVRFGSITSTATGEKTYIEAIHFNVRRLGREWFDVTDNLPAVLDLIIHEFGHHYESNHLSTNYYKALSDLGGRMTMLALEKSGLFGRSS
jgi:hypothetical protein